jgi:CRISPR/Cas system-associated exonuclease Cas4 (RecB family)
MSDRDWSAYAKSEYNWTPSSEKHLRMTKTSLTSDFEFCPKQYEYKRIHRLPEPSTDAMVKGTNVHDAIEKYYDNVPTVLDELYTLVQRDKWDEAMQLALSVIPEQDYQLGEEGSIEQRIRWDLQRLQSGGKEAYMPVINELEVHAFVEEEFEFNGEVHTVPIHFAGSIDRGYATEDGTYAVMELKTGKWLQTKNKNDVWEDQSYKMQAMRTEMAFYKKLLGWANHPFQDVTHWGWVHPSGGEQEVEPMNKYGKEQRAVNRIIYEACTGRTWTTYSKKIDRMKNALLTAYFTGDFPTKASTGKCSWCNFKSICPSWEGSDNPQEYLDNYEGDEE